MKRTLALIVIFAVWQAASALEIGKCYEERTNKNPFIDKPKEYACVVNIRDGYVKFYVSYVGAVFGEEKRRCWMGSREESFFEIFPYETEITLKELCPEVLELRNPK